MIWVWADTHFMHDPKVSDLCRGDVRVMENRLCAGWESCVGAKDDIYICGDLFSYSAVVNRDWMLSIRRLPGTKYLIRGNHDNLPLHFYKKFMGFKMVSPDPLLLCNSFVLSHWPVPTLRPGQYCVHGHTHTYDVDDDRYVNIGVDAVGYQPLPLSAVVDILLERNVL
jgi:calcineurin-like phosphoesterase family protein